uniref:Uncharacterized protein n=1 Tax=Oryza glaberrima TaxID=4538 RepID=I1QH39_ORYGL
WRRRRGGLRQWQRRAAAARRVEAARLPATAVRGVEAAVAAPSPSLPHLAEGERGVAVRRRRGLRIDSVILDELVISLLNVDSMDWIGNGWELDWKREATAGNGGGCPFFFSA